MIDGEISYKSLLFVSESLEQLLGQHGAKAVLRSAGQRASTNLIEMLPLTLPEDEAARRTGYLLVDFGFIEGLELSDPDTLKVSGNYLLQELEGLKLEGTQSVRYYLFGLFEGFFKQMSGSARKIVSFNVDVGFELWHLG